MNCLDYRREKLADPRRLSDEARVHVRDCMTCAAFAREVDATEQALERALRSPVPEGLAERIIFRSGSRGAKWRAWALAASLLLAAGTGFFLGTARHEVDTGIHARLAIEHVVLEPESLTAIKNADANGFETAVRSFGATVKELPGKIRYVSLCPVEDGYGWHIVFETPEGLATLILVPGKRIPRAVTASAGGWSALARPVRGGYYAIVTRSPEVTSRFEKMLLECITWNA